MGYDELTGRPEKLMAGIPFLVYLKPQEQKNGSWEDVAKVDLNDKDSLRLWVVNYIPELYLAETEDGDWGKPYETNLDGCLVRFSTEKKRKIWIYNKKLKEGKKLFFHFTTIPIDPVDVNSVCKTYTIKEKIASTGPKEAKRPYYKDTEAQRKRDPVDKIENAYVVEIPTQDLTPASAPGYLSYWETVMYQESTDKHLDPFRDRQTKKLFNKNDLEQLKETLKIMRGPLVGTLVGKEKNIVYIGSEYSDLPSRVYDISKIARGTVSPSTPRKSPDEGPYWMICQSHDSREEAVKEEPPEEGSEPPPDKGEATISFYRMARKHPGTGKPFVMPKAIDYLPPITDRIIDKIKNATQKKFDAMGPGEKDSMLEVKDVIKDVIRNSTQSDYGNYTRHRWKHFRDHYEEISRFFYFAYSEKVVVALLYALDGAAKHWRSHSECKAEDFMKKEDSPAQITIETNVIVGFATKNDGFSESPTPKHVYFQLKDWWDNLCDTDKDEIYDSFEIKVLGYTSFLGGPDSDFNKKLREMRAWKTAKSLELLFKRHGKFKKPLKLVDPSLGTSVSSSEVPVIYEDAKIGVFPSRDLAHIFSPAGSMVCDVLIDSNPIAAKAVKKVDPKNDPRDRIGLIIFKRHLKREVTQFVREKGSHNAAHVLSAFRAVHISRLSSLPSIKGDGGVKKPGAKVLVYAIPGSWK